MKRRAVGVRGRSGSFYDGLMMEWVVQEDDEARRRRRGG